MQNSYLTGEITIAGYIIPQVSTILNFSDFLGAVRVRWGIKRDNFRINPGLYAVGTPDSSSDVFVTANYKLSFDTLRKNFAGADGWILVLDTKGVNVWCAAGKGTFGTKELIERVRKHSIDQIVNHKRLILPQLGATGVAAHIVKDETGFNVHYGPVKASDIKKFIKNGYRADKEMRRITFNLKDRIKLIPNDFVYGKYYLLGAIAVVLLISSLSESGVSIHNISANGFKSVLNIFLAYFSGTVITPALLPVIPSKRFSLKGFYSGTLIFLILFMYKLTGNNILEVVSWFLIITAVSSFLAMNFTGSSTYTSLSGVKKEMKYSLPMQITFVAVGVILQVIGKIIN